MFIAQTVIVSLTARNLRNFVRNLPITLGSRKQFQQNFERIMKITEGGS